MTSARKVLPFLDWCCLSLHTEIWFCIWQSFSRLGTEMEIRNSSPVKSSEKNCRHVPKDGTTMLRTSLIIGCLSSWMIWHAFPRFSSFRLDNGKLALSKSSREIWMAHKGSWRHHQTVLKNSTCLRNCCSLKVTKINLKNFIHILPKIHKTQVTNTIKCHFHKKGKFCFNNFHHNHLQ